MMSRWNKYLSGYLSFTRKERTCIIVIIVFIIFFSVLPLLFPFFIRPKPTDHTAFKKEIAELKISQRDSTGGFKKDDDENNLPRYYRQPEKNYYSKQPHGELFYFDPNTLSEGGWKRLGIREKTITTIRNYITKGGRFYKPEDIGKIWGLHEDQISRLMPYVRIEEKQTDNFSDHKNTGQHKVYDKPKYSTVDINAADTSAFIALPGIGSKLAHRIITFRNKLGGFYRVEQLAETYGLPDSTFQKIKDKLVLADPSVKKIDINIASVDELKNHPYIRYNIANAIVQYRNQHGNFTAISELKNIMIITGEIYSRIEPYISIHQL